MSERLHNAVIAYRLWVLEVDGGGVKHGWEMLTPEQQLVWVRKFKCAVRLSKNEEAKLEKERWLTFFLASPHAPPSAKAEFADQMWEEYKKRFVP